MSEIHDGVAPWWLQPRLVPELPPLWDVASRFRESLRYSLAGAYQGSLLAALALGLAALGLPFRGVLLFPIAVGLPLWVLSEILLIPRPGRPMLREYAKCYPGLWQWSRAAVAREDRRAMRGLLLLHVVVLGVLVPEAWVLWPQGATHVWFLGAFATGIALSGLQAFLLVSGANSAGLPWRWVASLRAAHA